MKLRTLDARIAVVLDILLTCVCKKGIRRFVTIARTMCIQLCISLTSSNQYNAELAIYDINIQSVVPVTRATVASRMETGFYGVIDDCVIALLILLAGKLFRLALEYIGFCIFGVAEPSSRTDMFLLL